MENVHLIFAAVMPQFQFPLPAMYLYRLPTFFALLMLCYNCGNHSPENAALHAEMMPVTAKPIAAPISNLNTWVESGSFFVTGICSNASTDWQKIWLEATPLDSSGKPLRVSKHSSVVLNTFSDAVPPNGRTAFFASWPLGDISGSPTACQIKVAGAVRQTAGPILVIPMVNALKMFAPQETGQPATEELAWQLSGKLLNPLPIQAKHPRLEILVFGTDNRLWFSTLLNPEDPAMKRVFQFVEGDGPLQPNESREFSLQVFYQGLPQALKEKKIGQIEVLPFEARPEPR